MKNDALGNAALCVRSCWVYVKFDFSIHYDSYAVFTVLRLAAFSRLSSGVSHRYRIKDMTHQGFAIKDVTYPILFLFLTTDIH